MKLCVVAYKFGTEEEIGKHLGTYHYFIEILRKLVKQGHEVKVIAPWLTPFKKGSTNVDGIKVVRYYPPMVNKLWLFPLNRIIRLLYIKATQKKVLQQKDVDAIMIWQARETGYAVSQIKEKLSAPVIFRQITTWKWHFERSADEVFGEKVIYKIFKSVGLKQLFEVLLDKKNHKKFADEIYKKCDKVAFVSQIAADEAIQMGLSPNKVEILPVSIETDIFRPLDKKQELRSNFNIKSDKVILFIGRINFAEKGIGVLLEAMPKVISQINNVSLVIVGGGGESERMSTMIDKLNIKDQVQLAGKQPFEKLAEYINACDVMVIPSIWMETFGQVTIEAMACGVPVVTSDAGASPSINIDGQTGIIVPTKNSQKLAEAIITILNNPELADKLGQTARSRVEQNYTYNVVVNKLLKIINNVTAK
ncbi:glycosyltransferase family 4 protein [Patescibacteria group bacterium]|nr:glycosyltransferase family 4 protein [Patescibacteria group bacterium]